MFVGKTTRATRPLPLGVPAGLVTGVWLAVTLWQLGVLA